MKLYPGAQTPLRDVSQGIDFVILRENLEGLFASFGGGCIVDRTVATDTIVITREGTAKVVDYAAESVILRVYGGSEKLDAMVALFEPESIVELVRSGKIVMTCALEVT